MALKLIGAVGLKVRPEAKNFRDEAERDIRRQMRGADRDGYKYPIKPEVDKQEMRRELDNSRQLLNDSLSDMQKQVDKKRLDLRVNNDKFRRDTDQVQRIYREMFFDMEQRKKKWNVSDQFRIDTQEFEDDLREVKHKFDRMVNDMDGEEIELHPTLDDSSYRYVWARLKWLTRDRFTTIHVKVNKASARIAEQVLKSVYNLSGARRGVDTLKDIGRYIRDLDKHVPTLAMIGTLAVSAVGGVTALVGSVAHLANELVRMSAVALALPGIMGGFAVGLGVMFVALKDFGNQMPEITSDLSDLAREIESNFWQEARIPMLEAWNKAFPHFQRGVEKTATSLGKWTAAFSEAFSAHFDMAAFDKMFGNLNKSIDIASLGLDDFVRSMSILGQTGSEYLPRLAMWANDVNRAFADWLTEAQRTGELNRMIDTGIQKMKELGVITREAGELVYILGSAAERAGFSGFGEMADGLERFNEKLKTTKGQKVLDDMFQGAARVADGFKRALGAVGDFVWNSSDLFHHLMAVVGEMVGDTFEKLFKAFERPAFQKGLLDFFDGVSRGVGKIADSAPAIADVAGAIGTLGGAVAENLGDVISSVFEAIASIPPETIEDVADAIDQLGDGLSAMTDMTSDLGLLAGALNLLAGAAKFAGGALEFLGRGLSILFGPGSIFDKGESFGDLFQDLIDADIPIISWSLEVMRNFAIGAGNILAAFKNWKENLQRGIEGIMDFFAPTLNRIKATIFGAWVEFRHWLDDLFGGSGGTTDVDTGGSSLVNSIADMFNFDGLDGTLGEKINGIIETVSGWWETLQSWLGGLFGGGEGGGGSFQFVIDFVMNAIDNASSIIGAVVNLALDWARSTWQGILQAVDNASNIIGAIVNLAQTWVAHKWQGVLTALDNARGTIQTVKDKALNYARSKYQAILTALDNARGTIQAVKNKALNYARGKYQAVLKALDNARSTIATVKSKAQEYARGKYDAVLRAIDNASSIVRGVQANINALKGKAVTITTNLVTKVKKIFSADGNYFPEVKKFANGGIENHVAQIAPAGAMRVWAEPETGGEAYIPFAKSKRARSEQILATVADKFGMRLERYANGSDPSGSAPITAAGGDTYNINVESVPTNVTEETTSAIMFNLKHMKRGGGLAFA